MTHIAFFGHDAGDAAIRRRIAAFRGAGYGVTGLMMRRGEEAARDWENIDLGKTYDAAYLQRSVAIRRGIKIAMKHAAALQKADLFYARNPDMLMVAAEVRRRLGLTTPMVYECLDIHHLMAGKGLTSRLLRAVEGRLLNQVSLLVYSSPAFEREYFAKHFPDQYTPLLLENRFVESAALPPRPQEPKEVEAERLRLGWFGILRCRRSLELLSAAAAALPETLEVVIHGKPATTQVPDFEAVVAAHGNIRFGGAYNAPEDLPALYDSVDVVWAGDFYQANANSRWLLPNRIYEGGYFAVPAIAPAANETGNWIKSHHSGFVLPEPLEATLPELLQRLITDPGPIAEAAKNLLALPRETFVQSPDVITALIEKALDGGGKTCDFEPREEGLSGI